MRLVRFFTVGWMGFVVQMAASVALTSVVHVSWLPATGAAAELSIIRNFFWHGLVFMLESRLSARRIRCGRT